jgi:3-oxo-4,17-pregnadiene-20-carboxyl-CoA hydratase alpha subunit
MPEITIVPPGIDHGNAWFWDGVADHELLIQRCASCGALRVPIAPMCHRCQSLEWDTVAAAGRGEILAWIVSHHPTEADAVPRIVALVELDEGVRVVSNVVDADPSAVRNDLAVELTFRTYGGVTLPQFRLATS